MQLPYVIIVGFDGILLPRMNLVRRGLDVGPSAAPGYYGPQGVAVMGPVDEQDLACANAVEQDRRRCGRHMPASCSDSHFSLPNARA